MSSAFLAKGWRLEASTSIPAARRTGPWRRGLLKWWRGFSSLCGGLAFRHRGQNRSSPSCASKLAALRIAMGKKPGEGSGRKWARGKGDHVPSIELYLDGRYFTITEQQFQALRLNSPSPAEMLLWLISGQGRRLQCGQSSHTGIGRCDSSRSAVALRKGAALRRAGCMFDQMAAALRADPETSDWCREKGDANDGRELQRIWDKAAGHDWLDHCQLNSDGNFGLTSPTPWWHCVRLRNCKMCSRMTRCCARRC